MPPDDPADQVSIRIAADPIPVDAVLASVADPGAGATCAFVGTVRDHGVQGAVTGLSYEAWEELAVARIRELADEAFAKWPLLRMAVWHRTGDLAIGEVSVAIAVSSAHRADAFEACRHAIERLKHDVPIWKKEALVSGEARWIMGS